MTDKELTTIEKFREPAQWTVWSFQIKVILKSADIYDVVTGDETTPAQAAADADATIKAAADKSISEWKKKDNKAQKIIVTSVGPKVMVHILNCTTSKQMWDKLKSIYDQVNTASKHLLQQKFFSYEKSASDDVATHISKLEGIAQKLKDMNVAISDDMLITKILLTLPAEYRHFISAWESLSEESRTITTLTSRLMVEECRMGLGNLTVVKSEPSEAFFAKQNKPNSGATKKNQPKGKSNGNKKGNCFKCGSSEHWKSQCPIGKSSNEQKSSDSKSNEKAFMSSVSNEISRSEIWYHDSGASSHTCNQRNWFSKYEQLSEPKEITLADGEIMKAVGKGEVEILSYNGTDWKQKTLKNVLFSPKSFANLFSSTSAMDNGHEFWSNNSTCKLLDNGKTVAVGVRENGLFRMMFKVIQPSQTDKSFANIAVNREPLRIWHERLGHQHLAHVRKFLSDNSIEFIDEKFDCDGCAYGKQHRLSFKLREEKSTACGQIIHSDLVGPLEVDSLGGRKYFLMFKDDYSHFRFVYFLKHKSEVIGKMKFVIKMTEKQFGHPIKILQTDNGLEFVNKEVSELLEENGIRHRRTVVYTPEQNGCAERENRTVMEAARSMLHAKGLDLYLWAEAVHTAAFVLNRTGTSTVKGKTAYELWYGKSAKFDNFRIFGSEVYVHVPKQQRRKLDAKAKKCIFVGYDDNVKGFRVMDEFKVIKIARDVKFLSEEPAIVTFIEDDETISGEINENLTSNEANIIEQTQSSSDSNRNENQPAARITNRRSTVHSGIQESSSVISNLRSRSNSVNTNMVALLAFATPENDEPESYEEAKNSPNHDKWLEAMKDEIKSLEANNVWELVEKPADQKIVDSKWVFKLKQIPNEPIDRFKARLVARGFTQVHGIDYFETFSPVVRYTSIRAILAIAAKRKLKMMQFDVKTAFLYGELQESVYINQPKGFDDDSGRVYKLRKSLYGLKQASRCWNQKFTSFIEKFGFTPCESDHCVFVSNKDGNLTILAIYVDDGLLVGSCQASIDSVLKHLQAEFEIKTMDIGYFLGMQIEQRSDGSIFINQEAYAQKVLRKFQMEESHALVVPSDPNQILCNFEDAEECKFPYRQLIGSLMYLSVSTRPDITYALGNVSRYMERPTHVHVEAAKRILRYVKGTFQFGITYNSDGEESLNGYSDSDYAGCIETRRSTSGFVFLLGDGIISWSSLRQKSVSLSTMEAEYIAASDAVKELVWIKRFFGELLSNQSDVTNFFMDNQSAIQLIKNPVFHKRSKHIDVRFHFIREKYKEGAFELFSVPSNEMIADILTKALPRDKFQYLRSLMNVGANEK